MTHASLTRHAMGACLLAGGLLLAGCATTTPVERAQMQADAARSVSCQGQSDCELKWGRALQWVLDNSAYKVATDTSSLISTLGPLPDDPRAAFTISRTPDGQGGDRITFRAGCDDLFGCIPSLVSLQASFVRAVMGPSPREQR